jgi:hypothetical protein
MLASRRFPPPWSAEVTLRLLVADPCARAAQE